MIETFQRPQLGGTDGFRAEYTTDHGDGKMNPKTIAGLSYVLTELQLPGSNTNIVVIGGDTRIFNSELENAAVAGIRAAGGEPLRLGVAPTPAILRTAKLTGAAAAIALTASHNPATDGGWKGTFGADKPYGEAARSIDEKYWANVDRGLRIIPEQEPDGTYWSLAKDSTWLRRYVQDVVEFVRNDVDHERPLAGKTLVVDAAYGAGYDIAPLVYAALGAEVIPFACDRSQPINQGAGATDLSGGMSLLRRSPEIVDKHFLGMFANDGDADRFIGLGARRSGKEVEFAEFSGNHTLELLAKGQPGVVGTVYTNDGAVERIRQSGTAFAFCPNGDVEVTAKLKEHGWRIGGEFSGHTVDRDWLSSGDGILSGARVAARIALAGTTMFDLVQSMPLYPEVMRKIALPQGTKIPAELLAELQQLSSTDVSEHFRSIVRKSGTEPVVRVWGLAKEAAYLRERIGAIEAAVRGALG